MGKTGRTTSRRNRRAADKSGQPTIDLSSDLGSAEIPTGTVDSGRAPDVTDGSVIDPASLRSANGGSDASSDNNPIGNLDPATGKRKYRKRGLAADTVSLELGTFKDLLFSTHAMLHSLTKSVLFEIDNDDAEKLAKAVANVTRHYDLPGMSQKTLDHIVLIQACGAIYGPRLMAMKLERIEARNAARQAPRHPNAPQNVAPAATAANAPAQRTPVPVNEMQMHNPHDMRKQPMPSAGDVSQLNGVAVDLSNAPVATQRIDPNAVAAPAQARNVPGMERLDGGGLPLKIVTN